MTTNAEKLTRVRVLTGRSLSLNEGNGIAAISTLWNAGDELELPPEQATQLENDGFVERAK